jgi:hypothetical protein
MQNWSQMAISKTYIKRNALRDVTFDIKIVVISGSNLRDK